MTLNIFAYLIIFFGIINLLRMTLFLVGSDIYNLRTARRLKKTPLLLNLPKFSVIIPARNEEGTIIRAIQSILHNNYPKDRLEIIVVDDGSTDKTVEKVQSFIEQNRTASITLVTQKNAGKAHALNNGIKNYASGDLVMCLDADSYIAHDALRNATKHFTDQKVMALSSNVKIIERPGLLNLTQRYEYMLCYQMKRAESLLNCEYIVGGIGSVFRRTILEKIKYYDTNTVTEDIDITMKILELGNKNYKAVYGADVVSYTESVMSVTDLIKQRFRWKWGRCQTFLKNKHMFFSIDSRFTKSLSWFYLPFALFGDLMYLLEPLLLSYIIAVSIVYQDPWALLSAWIVISTYLMLNILAEDTFSAKTKVKLLLLAPFIYILFYILNFVEYIALMKSVFKLHTLRQSLLQDKAGWVRVSRPSESKKSISLGNEALRTYVYAFSVIVGMVLTISIFVYEQPKAHAIQAISTPSQNVKPINKVDVVSKATPTPEQVQTHVVQPGETLWKISRQYYGTGSSWKKLIVRKKTSTLRPGDIVEIPQE